ncbi:benzoylformate decarboxylase [Variibacter gotjawalensis]|uniref:Benzoylformate decarboxylase n=1 Tax=Variibacter gotjawalensis TaxID=1333996 RepID=A0A0S3PNP5_9BRAD|nr:thiamine pyrophosphate-binding protein [Variibacter gotjawalensis]NIK47791.1 benzoylformate decarboxylase [Variibacter gotjawalensis]RZS49678.1 benzoylformate decarboxylase [Variibacter gotjawalensis]BAT57507.1 benzoylformate decarboxylase [Variibacter gotjawalensis]
MPIMSGKRAFLEILRQEGVDVIFGNPGTTELPLMDALAVEPEPRYILGLQEAVVMAMAGGYAQAGKRLAVVSVHVTPGLGNAMGMLYDAYKAGAPVLVTAGQHEQGFNVGEPILWGDLPPIARPLVKWSAEVHRVEDLPRMLRRAITHALAPPMGPVFLSLPGDILEAEGDLDLGAPTRVATRTRADADALAEAAKLLLAAENPIIVVGGDAAVSGAEKEVLALAEMLGAPMRLETIDNTAPIPTAHPLFAGSITRLEPSIRKILDQHDVMLSIGADIFTLSLPSDVHPLPDDFKIIHIDSDPWELGKNYPEAVAMVGDAKASMEELGAIIGTRMTPSERDRAAERRTKVEKKIANERDVLRQRAKAEAANTPPTGLALIDAISEILPPNAIVVEEVLSSQPGVRQLILRDEAQNHYGMRGGGIGWGLSAALGVQLAQPERPVVALIGDGSAMYTIQALWTAANAKLPVVYVIFNNTSYRILKQRIHAMRQHAAQTDTYVAMDLDDPPIDFPNLARSMGIRGERATTLDEAKRLISECIAAKKPALIDVVIDRNFKPL